MPTVDELLEKVSPGHRTVFDVVGEKDGGGKLTVEMRKLHPEEARAPKRAESKARAHVFYTAESLRDYLARYGSEDTVIFADPSGGEFVVILAESAKDGHELLWLRPEVHPLWKPWADLCARGSVPIEEFAEFLLMNRRAVMNGREVAFEFSQIDASVSVEIKRGRGKKAVNGVTITTNITGGGQQKQDVELPETIKVNVPLFVGTPEIEIELDIHLEAHADGEVHARVSPSTIAEARVEAFELMVSAIRGEGCKATVTYGRPAHVDWRYLRELAEPTTRP